jgi:DNA-binding IclR family transcriptional regulator
MAAPRLPGEQPARPLSPSVLWKAFDVLDAFSHRRRVLTLAEVARHSGLPKSTVHRVLAMLTEVGAVETAPGGYQVGLRMFSLGAVAPEAALREAALPHLGRLHQVTGQVLHLAVLRDGDVVYLEKLLPRGTNLVTPSLVGNRMPATCTGVGKALLAFASSDMAATALGNPLPRRTAQSIGSHEELRRELDAIRKRGHAFDRGEAADGLACVAVPVLAPGAGAVAAVSVAFPASAGSGQALVDALRTAAAAISRSPAARLATSR